MNKNRLEAFSDGVFAIVITLLVLNIRIPDVEYKDLPDALIKILPKILSYVMSFAVIGLYWVAHHYYFEKIRRVNGTFVWLNMLVLLLVSFMPIPTYLLGEYPKGTIPLAIYGLNLVTTNMLGWFMIVYLHRHKELINEHFTEEFYKAIPKFYLSLNSLYILGIIFAFINPIVSYSVYISVLMYAIYVFASQMNKAKHQ